MPSELPPAPSPQDLQAVVRLLMGLRRLHDPVFLHLDRAPTQGPRLFVSNHSLYAVLDFPQLYLELYRQRGIFLRGLGHSAHFKVPGWGPFLRRMGVVEAGPEACGALLDAGEPVLVFPGGGREAAKRRGERYQLLWKQRLGFAREAIRHGATVVPLACYGAEHAWDIVLDGPEVMERPWAAPLRAWYKAVGAAPDELFPLVRGLGPTPLPRPVRLYFSVGEPIDARPLAGRWQDEDALWDLRRRVEASITDQLAALAALHAEDPDAAFGRRAVKGLIRRLTRLERAAGGV